jgi:hypothetical protein
MQIAPVLPDSQNAGCRERLGTVAFVLSQMVQRERAGRVQRAPSSQLPQQTPFAFELSYNGYAGKRYDYEAGYGEKATSGQTLKLTRSVFA